MSFVDKDYQWSKSNLGLPQTADRWTLRWLLCGELCDVSGVSEGVSDCSECGEVSADSVAGYDDSVVLYQKGFGVLHVCSEA